MQIHAFVYSTGMTIPIRLQEAMDRAGIKSQSELARRSGVPQPTINRILKGVGRLGPATETLKKLAAACEVPFQWLADGPSAEQRPGTDEETVSATPGLSIEDFFIVPKSLRTTKVANPVYIRKVRLRQSAQGNKSGVHPDEKTGEEIYLAKEWLRSHGYDDQTLIAFSMMGESMAPSLYAGDTIVVNIADRQPLDGEVFVLNYENKVVVSRLIRDAGRWWLCSDSFEQRRFPRKLYSERDCSVIGRVVYKLSEKI